MIWGCPFVCACVGAWAKAFSDLLLVIDFLFYFISFTLFLPARRYASAGTSCGPVSVGLCLSQVGVLSKRLDESGWFLARELLSTRPTL